MRVSLIGGSFFTRESDVVATGSGFSLVFNVFKISRVLLFDVINHN